MMSTLRWLAVAAVVCVLSGAARAEDKPDYAKMIVGKWEITKADEGTVPVGTIVVFTDDGKIKLTGKKDDKDIAMEGTYKVEGDKFTFTFKEGAEEHSDTITITKISKTEMSTKNKEGKVVECKKKS
jgi:uncharacterized protein (TIGR03066 family)